MQRINAGGQDKTPGTESLASLILLSNKSSMQKFRKTRWIRTHKWILDIFVGVGSMTKKVITYNNHLAYLNIGNNCVSDYFLFGNCNKSV